MLVLTGHCGTVTGCAFGPDGRLLATTSGDWDKTVLLWDTATGREVRELGRHDDWVTGCAFTADGDTVVTWSGVWTVRAWPVSGRRERSARWVRRHLDPALVTPARERGFAVSPDGTRCVVTGGGFDPAVRVLDVQTGAVLHTLDGHTDWVHGCAFSPDGSLVATASGDTTAALWDVRSGSLVQRLTGHSGWVTACAFSPDGTQLATTSADHTARLWAVAPPDPA